GFSTSVYCTGIALPLGEIFQFFILSVNDNRVLAQGNFSIIGLALAAIDIYTSPTLGTPSTAMTVSATETFLPGTPAPPTSTRTPSYPNPPTPTLSYPNPKP
ncbi:MAG TPA: hypothetical protein VMN99_12750, partial [Anaerolineales bacterium]|nr:hypothetical protein [Anaerolineales bacterium]